MTIELAEKTENDKKRVHPSSWTIYPGDHDTWKRINYTKLIKYTATQLNGRSVERNNGDSTLPDAELFRPAFTCSPRN